MERWWDKGLHYAVLDLETTGFGPRHEIVELAILHVSPQLQATPVLDTLVKPSRRIGNREVHGINNRQIRHAPRFEDISGAVCDALAGRVCVAHNAAFDIPFLERALEPWALSPFPSMCTMKLR